MLLVLNHVLQLQKVKCIVLLQDRPYTPKAILFTPCQYILLFETVVKCIPETIFNY